jgi:serine/threonine-protein kinase
VRDLAGTESRLLPGTDDAWMPFFSPDDESIGFFANEKLKRIDVAGGIPSTLCDAPDGRGGSWGTNDMIVFAPTTHSALMQVSAHGGIPTPLTTIDSQSGESGHRWPQLLPDNRAVIFAAGPSMTMSNFNEGQLVVQSLKTGERHVLVDRGTYPKYLSTGHLAYVANDAVFARPFDLQRLEVTGPPVPVLADVAEGAAGQKPVDISATGTVVYSPGSSNTQRSLFLVDANGTAKPLPLAADRFEYPLVSPDGRLLAVAIVGGQDTDIWVYDVASGGRTPLTSGGVNKPLAWTRDGHHVAYASSRGAAESIYWRRADGSEPEQRLAAGTGMPVGASFAAGDRAIVFDAFRGEKGADVLKLPLPASGPPVPLSAASLSNAQDPQISPDGELLAYALARPERTDIFVRSLSSDGVVAQVSLDGGVSPRWAHSGRELFFLDDGVLMAVAVVTKPALTVSRPHRVMPHPSGNELTFAAVDVLPGDRKFIALEPDRASNFHDIGVIVNWFEELKATMAPR